MGKGLPGPNFSADWLALREPADHAARSASLARAIARRLADAGADPVRAMDLAAGTGANARYLADCLPGRQDWLLIDRDPALLSVVADRTRPWAFSRGCQVEAGGDRVLVKGSRPICAFTTRVVDLSLPSDARLFAGHHLVTASALLDLVSEPWLRDLIGRCRENRAQVLFALTYDGRLHGSPEEPEDREVCRLVNEHQRGNKGFGRALGPDASDCAEQLLREAGYVVQRAASDWVLSPAFGELQAQLIAGWSQAARERAPERSAALRDWEERRIAHVASGASTVTVGHVDLAAWLAD